MGTSCAHLSGVLCRKLQQLEAAAGHANLKRASYSRGWNCIWCTCVCHRRLLPDYLREWDLSHA